MTITEILEAYPSAHRQTVTTRAVSDDKVHDQLKNIFKIEHPRRHSAADFLVNFVASLLAYTYQAKTSSSSIPMPQAEPMSGIVL